MFVALSYKHDEEDAASPSVSQTAAVTRPHLRVFPEWIMLRVPKIAPVFLLFIELEFGQEVRNAVGL